MTTYKDVRNNIVTAFDAGWGSYTVIAYDNEPFTPPVDNTSWARLTIIFNSSDIASLGSEDNRLFRRYGIIMLDVFTERGRGMYVNDIACQKALNIFEGKTLAGGIRIYRAGIETIEVEDKWFHQRVNAEFEFDETL